MSQDQTTIGCPKCGEQIDVNDILYQQVDKQLKEKYQDDLRKEQESFASKTSELEKQRQALAADKEKQAEAIETQVKEQLRKKETALAAKLKSDVEQEQKEATEAMQKELAEKSAKISELNKTSAQLEALKREKNELEDKYKVEAERIANEKLSGERERIQKEESAKSELAMKEMHKQLEDQKKLTEEMKRKQEQGSMQLQGEVLELAIEEWLAEKFPLDTIDEVKKGAMGADCLQIVNTRAQQNCGSIYYESKRTKTFSATWIEKFKQDIRDRNADIGVIVTEAMPSDMDRMGMKDGVWICSFQEFKGLCTALRQSLISINSALVVQENKGDKMGMLYDYLTGNEFRLQIEAIVEGFTQMQTDLASEQRAMRAIWKKREKQIDKVLLNTTGMYGSVRGIAGNAVQTIPELELFDEDDDQVIDDQD